MNDDEAAKSLFFEGLDFLDARDWRNAETRFRNAFKLRPASPSILANLSLALVRQNQFAEAGDIARRAIAVDADNVASYLVLLECCVQAGQFDEALTVCEKILGLEPGLADAHFSKGFVLGRLERHDQAVASYEAAIALRPELAAAHLNRSISLRRLRRYAQARAACDAALRLEPRSTAAHLSAANIDFETRQFDAALASYCRALDLDPAAADAWVGYANSLGKLRRYDEALAALDKALALQVDDANAWLGLGNVRSEMARHDEALSAFNRALTIDPKRAEAWLGIGNVLFDLARYAEASEAFGKAAALQPDFAEAWLGRGSMHLHMREHEAAIAAYDTALALQPDLPDAAGSRLYARMYICDWDNLDSERAEMIAALRRGERVSPPFMMLALSSSGDDQLRCAKTHAAHIALAAGQPLWRGERYRHDRIVVAYLSADFREHPVAHLLAGVFEQHDRSRFETVAISFGVDDGSATRHRVQRAFSRFIDVRGQGDAAVARLLRESEIDIAIDLMGHTLESRAGILAARPAPIQINYLGYPGAAGADFIDYTLADRFVVPQGHECFYREKIIRLPHCFQANDSQRPAAGNPPSRPAAGLPETGFVFCAFSNTYKITPDVFDVWVRLLKNIDGSVLWLLAESPATERNLLREAASRGIDRQRIVFAGRVGYGDYLARYRLADILLDTLPFNAGTTASDALWSGLPIVTCAGEPFAARMAGSLLEAVGLPELITHSLDNYESLALRLAREPQWLAALKARLEAGRETCPLFDTRTFTRHLEAGYAAAWQRYQRGEAPADIDVDPSAPVDLRSRSVAQ